MNYTELNYTERNTASIHQYLDGLLTFFVQMVSIDYLFSKWMRKSYQDLQVSPESNKSSIVYHWAYTYIYFRIHIGFRPALFLDRDSHWRERKKKGLIIFLQNTESLTDEKRSKRGWPIRVKKIEWRERFNRTDSITRMMSIGREARAIMMLAGRFIKHAIARYLEWLISGYRLSSFMLLIKIV